MGVATIFLPLIGVLLAQVALPSIPFWVAKRGEVPIREITLSNGTTRYGVPIVIGTAHIEAGLDTGSTGLRVLLTDVKNGDIHSTQTTDYIEFGGGTRLDGSVANASIAIGALSGSTNIQIVRKISCAERSTDCASTAIPLPRYRFMGAKQGEGFEAILGINMGTSADVANPFLGLGTHRWIIDLPRRGEPGSGRLVLNPTDAEVMGYTPVETVDEFATAHGSLHDAVRGCIVNEMTQQKICGAMVLDTGDPGLRVVHAGTKETTWSTGTPITLFFANKAQQVHIAEHAVVNSADPTTRFIFEERPGAPQPFILTGVLPYLAYSILYDAEHHTVSFKPRPVLTGAPYPLRVN